MTRKTKDSKRHSWGWTPKSKTIDISAQGCKKCSCVRQWVAGDVTYFINDNVYLKAPPCEPTLL